MSEQERKQRIRKVEKLLLKGSYFAAVQLMKSDINVGDFSKEARHAWLKPKSIEEQLPPDWIIIIRKIKRFFGGRKYRYRTRYDNSDYTRYP